MSKSAAAINTKLIDSLAQIILSLTNEERQLLVQKIQHPALSDVDLHQGFPFDVLVPNAETLATLEEVEKHPERLKCYNSVDQMFEDWDKDAGEC
jgi:antitoxin component of RelBE/YafQ-DinJ toxin-antitoxin module